jgi:hypothetical protein
VLLPAILSPVDDQFFHRHGRFASLKRASDRVETSKGVLRDRFARLDFDEDRARPCPHEGVCLQPVAIAEESDIGHLARVQIGFHHLGQYPRLEDGAPQGVMA